MFPWRNRKDTPDRGVRCDIVAGYEGINHGKPRGGD
jgi:hypothetical protein